MAIDLINIDSIVLSNDFESWFNRTNEVIDALNPLQIYDFYDGGYATVDLVFPTVPGYLTVQDITEATTLGLKITRDVRFFGDMQIEILPEAPLGFNTTTGALTFVFTGSNAPPLLGTSCTPPDSVDRLDRYIVWDDSAGVTKVVEAQKMLPLIIECDHQFGETATPVTITIKGDLIVDGNQTILSTTNVSSEDKNIDLNDDGTGTGVAAGDDTVADGGGITLLSTDGNKTLSWLNAGDRWFVNQGWEVDPAFSVFTTRIEPQGNMLNVEGSGTFDAVAIHLHETVSPTNPDDAHWRLTLQETTAVGQLPYTLDEYPGDPTNSNVPTPAPFNLDGTFKIQHSTLGDATPAIDLGIVFDSVTPTHDPTIQGFARNLNADLLDGCHATVIPTPHMIPCADNAGFIDSGWIPFTGAIKEINQTAHGFTLGQVVRIDKVTPFGYILAQADSLDNAEAVGVVGSIIDANNFQITLRGCMELTTGEWDAVTGDVGGLLPGGVYFLDKNIAGRLTTNDPAGGDISKTMFIAIDTTSVIVMNYVGGKTNPISSTPTIELTGDVIAFGLLGVPLTATIIERTQQLTAVGVNLPLNVEDSNGVGFRTFEIDLQANTILELTLLPNIATHSADWDIAASPNRHTNSVTIVITQDGTGGHTPAITVAGGTIVWDNSPAQPVVQAVAGKTTIYTLINGTSNPTVWYGNRSVLEL